MPNTLFSTPSDDQKTQAATALTQIGTALDAYNAIFAPADKDTAANTQLMPLATALNDLFSTLAAAEFAAWQAAAETALEPFLPADGPGDERPARVYGQWRRFRQLYSFCNLYFSNNSVVSALRTMSLLFTDVAAS